MAISVHGIRTYGPWQKTFATVMSGHPTKVESYDYGWYGLGGFLIPALRSRKIDEFYEWYSQKVRGCRGVDLGRYDRRPCLAAHSFGTWIAGYAMLKFEDIRFDKLILCGSILPCDFDWATLFARDQVARVRNECGWKDPWPQRAGRLIARMGRSGSQGFDWFDPPVEDIPCEEFGHRDFQHEQHMEACWRPFLFHPPSPLALLHGRDIQDRAEFSQILTRTGESIDAAVYHQLDHYAEVEITLDLAMDWIRINPDIYTFLIDRSTRRPAGYINAMPVEDNLYAAIRSGGIPDNGVRASGILPFAEDQSFKIFLMSIAISEESRRWGEGLFQQGYVQLFKGLLYKLTWYARNRSIRVTKVLATAWTDEGHRLCRLFSMNQVSEDKFGNTIYELDLADPQLNSNRMPALKRLLAVYNSLPGRKNGPHR